MSKFISLLTLCSFFLTGCCTVRHQSFQPVGISSSPSGANIIINGEHCGTTPQVFEIEAKYSHEIILEKEGYQPIQYAIQSKASPARLSSNLLFPVGGGLLGAGVGIVLLGGVAGTPVGVALAGAVLVIAGTVCGLAAGGVVGVVGTGVDLYSGKGNQLYPNQIEAVLVPLNPTNCEEGFNGSSSNPH